MNEMTIYSQALRIVAENPMLAKAIIDVSTARNASLAVRPKMALTAKQRDLLEFIRAFSAENGGVAPSYEEMMHAMGLASKSGIHRLVVALEERGFINRLPERARAIVIVERAA